MKRQWWFRVMQATALVVGYFWYNTNVRALVARVLS
jgi:hypothetical protein